MGIIAKMRKQNAIYWPPATPDNYGRPTAGTLVELVLVPGGSNYRVRWENKTEQYLDAQGTIRQSTSVVYVPRLPDGSEVVVGGSLWLGDRDDLTDEAIPSNNPGAGEIQRFDTLPNLKNTEYLRTCYL